MGRSPKNIVEGRTEITEFMYSLLGIKFDKEWRPIEDPDNQYKPREKVKFGLSDNMGLLLAIQKLRDELNDRTPEERLAIFRLTFKDQKV